MLDTRFALLFEMTDCERLVYRTARNFLFAVDYLGFHKFSDIASMVLSIMIDMSLESVSGMIDLATIKVLPGGQVSRVFGLNLT